MMNPESKKNPITLEDLLRLKRAERPAPEFWATFEKELRAKQLAAIVEKRPWWNSMPRLLGTWKRYPLPLGASAILAVTFISVHQYQTAGLSRQQPAMVATETVAVSEVAANSIATEATDLRLSETGTTSAPVVAAMETSAANDSVQSVRAEVTLSGRVAEIVPWLGAQSSESEVATPTVVQSLMAANLETVKAAHPELARKFLGRAANFETTEVERKQAADPFTHLRGPAEIKRDRLLAKALPTSANPALNGSDRIARRLSEERLTEEAISRITGSGDRLSLKF